MKLNPFHLFLILFTGLSLHAQQSTQITQWNFHQFSYNPAHAGIKRCFDVHALFRTQWVGFQGAPQNGVFTFSAPLKSKRTKFLSARHGMGFRFENDRIGPFTSNRFNIAYARHVNFTQDNRLSMGLYGGILQLSYNGSSLIVNQPDPSVTREATMVLPDAHAGLWWNSTTYYVGLSIQNLIQMKWRNVGFDSRNKLHILLNGGYQFELNESLNLEPLLMVKIPPKGPLAFDLNLMLDYQNKFGFGVGYRNTDALLFFANFKIKEQLSIHYSFDFTLSKIQKGAQNTHEVSLIFTGCKVRSKKVNACPLFE